jgi:chromosome segregation ATPase
MRAIPVLAAALVAAGCASGPPTVMDADYGRLRPDQAAAVDSARAELARANVELASARAQNDDAAREEKAAATERTAAEKELDRAKKRVEAAEARTEYAERLVEARKAAESAAQQRVDVLSAKIEVLKLEALEQAKLQPSKPYDSKAFYGRVSDAQKKLEDAQGKMRKLEQQAKEDKERWEDLQRKVPAAAE